MSATTSATDNDMEIESTSLSPASYLPPQPQLQDCSSSSNNTRCEEESAAATFDSYIDDGANRMTLPLFEESSDAIAIPSSVSSSPSLTDSPPPAGLNATSSETSTTTNGIGSDFGISLMQSSPPPHSYRHSRAYRHFKNPPQPHMCIRTTTDASEELFINVLSWTRIVIPQEPTDPIPLYGGMRVPPGSPRSPPIVFAVMANPQVLKDSGRHCKDPEERRAMVELMCDFVEAMNPGVKLIRNAVILKDRDISGELKDVWNAVQAQRDREREEQMMEQRKQQHYHNITTQQMFPKSAETSASSRLSQQQRLDEEITNISSEIEEAANEMTTAASVPHPHQQLSDNKTAAEQKEINLDTTDHHSIATDNINKNNTIMDGGSYCGTNDNGMPQQNSLADGIGSNDNSSSSDQTDPLKSITKDDANIKLNSNLTNASHNNSTIDNQTQTAKHKSAVVGAAAVEAATTAITSTLPTSPTSGKTKGTIGAISNNTNITATAAAATVAPLQQPPPPPAKKDKLAGFLPNGCIFPRFKNNKHKDKDKEKEKEKEAKSKDKEKEAKPKDKEKTLLNALKKSKEKKVAPIEQISEKASPPTATTTTSTDANTKSQYEKNCINLESEIQKLDINKIDPATNNENIFIKLKVSATSAAAK